MSGRLWYPQLDVYDTARRLAALLFSWSEKPPVVERLYIADFYLANPPLLHKTSMPAEVRKRFQKIGVPHPDKIFLSYPTAPILFHKMEPIQRKALQALMGKGVIAVDGIRRGLATLSDFGVTFVDRELSEKVTASEDALISFLTEDFATIGTDDIKELRRRTGLRRVA